MDVPANLIKLIEDGQAIYQTAALGGAGAYSLPVPENKYIVIFGFTWNHYFDWILNEFPQQEYEKLRRATKHLQFQSRQQRFHFNFRTLPQVITIPPIPPLVTPVDKIIPANGAENIPCYQVHRSDVNISVWDAPPPNNWTFDGTFLPNGKGTIEPKPLGYGRGVTGLPTAHNITPSPATNPTWKVNPVSQRNLPANGARVEFVSALNANTAVLIPRDSPEAAYDYPLINVYYVIVNEPINSHQRS